MQMIGNGGYFYPLPLLLFTESSVPLASLSIAIEWFYGTTSWLSLVVYEPSDMTQIVESRFRKRQFTHLVGFSEACTVKECTPWVINLSWAGLVLVKSLSLENARTRHTYMRHHMFEMWYPIPYPRSHAVSMGVLYLQEELPPSCRKFQRLDDRPCIIPTLFGKVHQERNYFTVLPPPSGLVAWLCRINVQK